MTAFRKFDPYALLREIEEPPAKVAKVAKVGPTLAALATLAGLPAEPENSGSVPREWLEGVARLIGMDAPGGYANDRWRVLVRDAERFLDTWAAQASALGWSTAEVFGCHRWAPVERYDAAGLVMRLSGDRVVAMTADAAVIENARGGRLRHYRRMTAPDCERVLIWEWGR